MDYATGIPKPSKLVLAKLPRLLALLLRLRPVLHDRLHRLDPRLTRPAVNAAFVPQG